MSRSRMTGNSKAAGFKIYMDGKPVGTTTEKDSLSETTVTEARSSLANVVSRRICGEESPNSACTILSLQKNKLR